MFLVSFAYATQVHGLRVLDEGCEFRGWGLFLVSVKESCDDDQVTRQPPSRLAIEEISVS